MRLSSPALLVDINRIDALKGIGVMGDVLRIGALTRHAELERSPMIAEHAPLLRDAIRHVAYPAVRNRCTIGGSVSFADPAAELPACVLVLSGTMVLRGRQGERRVPAKDFFVDLYESARADDELLEAIEVPVATGTTRHGFTEVARRHGDFAMVGVSAWAEIDGEAVSALRLGFFGTGNTPVLSSAAGQTSGRPLSPESIEALAKAAAEALDPNEDLQSNAAMKKHLASVLTVRVLRAMME